MVEKVIVVALVFVASVAHAQTYSIADFGAKPDSAFLNTKAIQAAIDKWYGNGGGEVTVPAGKYMTGTVFLKSNVYLHLLPGSIWQGSYSPADYCSKN